MIPRKKVRPARLYTELHRECCGVRGIPTQSCVFRVEGKDAGLLTNQEFEVVNKLVIASRHSTCGGDVVVVVNESAQRCEVRLERRFVLRIKNNLKRVEHG